MPNTFKITILETEDGSSTLASSRFENQSYHSNRGAISESKHVYTRFLNDGDRVLEIGFGSGLNTLLSLESGFHLDYTSIELYPIDIETVKKLSFYNEELEKLHTSPWEEWINISPIFKFRKIHTDITKTDSLPHYEDDEKYNIVFFDAFSPDVVPHQWSYEVFSKIYELMSKDGILLTYSAKGDVKRALRAAGFTVKRLEGALGKHNMLKAIRGTSNNLP